MSINLDNINVIAELERNKVKFEFTGDNDEIKINCPFHSDQTASCFVNIKKCLFKCHAAGCEQTGEIISLLAMLTHSSRNAIISDISSRYDIENNEEDIIDFNTIERFFNTPIPDNLLVELYNRGITNEDIKEYRIGFDNSTRRIAVPIRNRNGFFINVRKYLPGAPGNEKFKNSKGHGKIKLFPVSQLCYDRILLCGGELKAIVAARLLNQHNIGAITATCGEDNWSKDLTEHFNGKEVTICFDIDEAGKKAAQSRAKTLYRITKSCSILELPLDITKYPHGDINDYVGQEKKTDLFQLISNKEYCKPYTPVFSKQLDNSEEPNKLHLSEALAAKNVGSRISISGVLSSIDTAPFVIPQSTFVSCDRSQKVCSICAIFKFDEKHVYELNSESANLLELVHSRKNQHRDALMSILSIPRKCPIAEFHISTYSNYQDARVSAELQLTDKASDRFQQPSLILDEDNESNRLELNESYEYTGRNWPNPNSQQSTLILSKYKRTTDALSNFVLTEEYKEKLKVFQPKDDSTESIQEKLTEIYDDLAYNVTHIFGRQDLHLVADLVYHSPLFFNYDNRKIKGWAEALIIGDTAQGKSLTTFNLRNFYNLGEKVESKNTSVAGLLGGLQKTGDRWFVTWGLFPSQDKRLIILEELKGIPEGVFAKLTDMRSSGFAEIPKIERRRTHARTRLLAISNSKSGRPLNTYTNGIESVRELIGSTEDIRRFDICIILANDEVDKAVINKLSINREFVEHKYTNDLCRNLILWSWTADCNIDVDAQELIVEEANKLPNEFHDSIPLVDSGAIKEKIARLASALAARLYSHDDSYNIIVKKHHVEYIVAFLRKIYNTKACGYGVYSSQIIESQKLKDEKKVLHELSSISEPKDFCKKLLENISFDQTDISDFAGCDREKASNLSSFLVRKNATHRIGGRYYKNAEFIEKLRYWSNNGVFDGITNKSEYLKKKQQAQQAQQAQQDQEKF